ncbi:MAG: low molecular weight phosphotyrosine protein phosphatase [Micrococcales bacterium]|nr:low molecular weight phosphotyrosine protein phosphatase [Micrococcales bacterium]MCL2667346.1 low molecular weight phosphotyrosine protein phosphatase [Micrococcales bacterium]
MTVCTGNICRSAMAEVVLRERLQAAGLDEQVEVCSRGVSDEEEGNPIDRRARTVLRAHGYGGGEGHVARQVTASELPGCDLVLAMTAAHARAVRRLARGADVPVVMYRSFDPSAPQVSERDEHRLDIADPWYGGPRDFETCLCELEAAADQVVEQIRQMLGDAKR